QEQFFTQRIANDRMNALKGDNLVINNITFGLCQRIDGFCEGYNPTTLKSYTQGGIHLNAYAYALLEPTYRASIDRVLDIASRT
ncbi:hypothetical protein PENTCL1PPCAC_15251, partial [Pristionchus entomophagus]